MPAKYFLIIRNYVLSVSSQRKYNFYHQNTFLDAFRTNSRNIIGRNPSMVIPLLANQDLTPMLGKPSILMLSGEQTMGPAGALGQLVSTLEDAQRASIFHRVL